MYRFLIFITILLSFSYCTNDSTDTEGDTSGTASTVANTEEPAKKHYSSSHEAPFCKLWVIKGGGGASDAMSFKGQWFNLKTDGTFESGKWEETNNSGTWSIEESSMIISFSFKSPEIMPSNWAIQGAGGGGKILFKGNVAGNPKGYQLVLEPETVLPVKY